MTDAELKDPDLFSAELHYALLSEGLKGPTLRRLLRVSRGDAELGRIFETKVSELRHYLRSSRKPTLTNLPVRLWERVSDNARFTPPKEVFMTLVYVGVAMIGIEFFKNHVTTSAPVNDFSIGPTANFDFAPRRLAPIRSTTNDLEQIDRWMIDELNRASQSPAWRETIKKQVAASLDSIDFESLLSKKIEAAFESPRIVNRLNEIARDKVAMRHLSDLSGWMAFAGGMPTVLVPAAESSLAATDAAAKQRPSTSPASTAKPVAKAKGGRPSQ